MPDSVNPAANSLPHCPSPIIVLHGRVNFRGTSSHYYDYSEAWPQSHDSFGSRLTGPTFMSACSMTALRPALRNWSRRMTRPSSRRVASRTFGLGHLLNGCTRSCRTRAQECPHFAVVRDVTRQSALTLAVAQTPPGEDTKKAEQEVTPGTTSTSGNCVRIGITCRRGITMSLCRTATMRKRKIY